MKCYTRICQTMEWSCDKNEISNSCSFRSNGLFRKRGYMVTTLNIWYSYRFNLMIHILSAEHVIENYPTLILFKTPTWFERLSQFRTVSTKSFETWRALTHPSDCEIELNLMEIFFLKIIFYLLFLALRRLKLFNTFSFVLH